MDFLAGLTPVARRLIRSWLTLLRSDVETDWGSVFKYIQRQTNVTRILIDHFCPWCCSEETVDFWKPVVQEFLCTPKPQRLVLLGFLEGPAAEFREDVMELVKPHRVYAWKQEGEHHKDKGLEIVRRK